MLALKFAYDGTKLDGFARQPGQKTVEGEIIGALRRLGIDSVPRFASRTDKWVSARGNVLAIETDFPKEKIIHALNRQLHHIWFYALADVPSDFNPRHAEWRWYRYLLRDEDFDLDAMKGCATMLIGEHNFSALAMLEKGKNPVRNVMSVLLRRQRAVIEIDIKAQSFLWSMVRGIVGLLRAAGKKEIDENDVHRILAGERCFKIGYAAPENLILIDVHYKGVRFRKIQKAIEKMKNELFDEIARIETRRRIIRHMICGL